jgi:hypothetical protein
LLAAADELLGALRPGLLLDPHAVALPQTRSVAVNLNHRRRSGFESWA